MDKLLVVVDMQNDFVTGSLGSASAKRIVGNVVARCEEYKNNGYDIVFTHDLHFDNYEETLEGKRLPVRHCVKGTKGWELIPELIPYEELRHSQNVNKITFGYGFWDSLLYDKTYDEIEVCGVCTDICVVSNALALRMNYPDMPITVRANCCAGTSKQKHLAALEVMKSCQIDVIE